MKVLLIGKNGQVGRELSRLLVPNYELISLGREELNLANPAQITQVVRAIKPQVIINCAAYTAVDQAEQEPTLAHSINGLAPGILAEEVKKLAGLLIHYSTDYVFDGTATQPYREEDPPHPLSCYGKSKLAGEKAIQAVAGRALIFRTSWVYGDQGKNFLLTMRRLAREREELRVVVDQVGAPTPSKLLAKMTAKILGQEGRTGLYHLTTQGSTSWYSFAQLLLELDPRRAEHRFKRLLPIGTTEYPTPAPRPPYSCLDCTKFQRDFAVTLPHWETALREI